MKARTEVLVTGSPSGLLSSLSYTTQDHPTRKGAAHRRLGLPLSSINQEKSLEMCRQGYLMEAIP